MHDVQGKHGPFGLGNLKGPAADRLSATLRLCGSLEEGIKRDALLTSDAACRLRLTVPRALAR